MLRLSGFPGGREEEKQEEGARAKRGERGACGAAGSWRPMLSREPRDEHGGAAAAAGVELRAGGPGGGRARRGQLMPATSAGLPAPPRPG